MNKPLPSERAPRSSRDPKTLLARLHRLAAMAGVTCLERAWRGNRVKHHFRCAQGHIWSRLPGNVSKTARCPHCDHTHEDRQRRLLSDGLARLQRAVTHHGGVCLTERYDGLDHRYRLQCAYGHTREATGRVILGGRWCPHCRERRRPLADGLAQLQTAARKHGGRCLSVTYRNVKTRYRFACAQGHQWEALGAAILAGHWCWSCAYFRRRHTLEDVQAVARQRGGACLSDTYEGTTLPLHWQCHRGHTWYAPFSNVRKGHWCPLCARLERIGARSEVARRRYLRAGDTPLATHRQADTLTC